VGSGIKPGLQIYISDPAPEELPALGGQQICMGDIVTMRDGHACQVGSVGTTGDEVNWGDVSRGAYMALASVDMEGRPDGDDTVPVCGLGSRVATRLDCGIAAGTVVGVDLRGVGANGKRIGRERAVTVPMLRPADRELWQRARRLSEAGTGGAGQLAALGRVTKVIPQDDPRRTVSRQGEIGVVRIGNVG